MWTLPQAKRAIVVGGSLSMAYTQLTTSPATIEFARELGATSFHIGVLGALPVALIFMQVIAALAVRHLKYRKPVWLAVSLVQRVVFLPAALGPWLLPEAPNEVWLWLLITLTFLNHAMLHFGNPLWLSWMGDYLPHQGLSSFWGVRYTSQQWTAAATMLVNALFVINSGYDIRSGFAGIIVLGCVLGVTDVLLFTRVEEPPARHPPSPRLWDIIAGPFREPRFRSYIRFTCFWHAASMIGAPFISLYLLEVVKMDLFRVILLWAVYWTGGALLSNRLGVWIDRFGQRPVLILCVAFKSSNMLALLCCPGNPTTAFWVLAPVFALDAFLSAGIAIANNGFLIKNSPRENRTMFVAAGTAYAGFIGGVTSIVAGSVLTITEGLTLHLPGIALNNYQVLFAMSILMRLGAVLVANRVVEPTSAGTREVVLVFASATRARFESWRRAA